MNTRQVKVSAISVEDTNFTASGERVEGYLNSWHLEERWTMQVEYGVDCSVSSGIIVDVVGIDINTLKKASND